MDTLGFFMPQRPFSPLQSWVVSRVFNVSAQMAGALPTLFTGEGAEGQGVA